MNEGWVEYNPVSSAGLSVQFIGLALENENISIF
jgi:hypothetical protein